MKIEVLVAKVVERLGFRQPATFEQCGRALR
jgi:hypothetical protein